MVLIILGRCGARFNPALRQVLPTFEIEHRHAMFGETEMVGSVVESFFRRRLQAGYTLLRGQGTIQIGVQLRFALADHHDVFRQPCHAERVHVDAAHCLLQRKDGVVPIIG